jgi:serine/threonine protein kinase
MEIATCGSLKQLINNQSQNSSFMSDSSASLLVKGVLLGVEYMHHQDIVHRDLKPENILLDSLTDYSQVKIADFGLSTYSEHSEMLIQSCGTLTYMAPELFRKHQQYSKPVDLWNVGLIMYELLSNQHPLLAKGDNRDKYQNKLLADQIGWSFDNDRFSEQSKDFFMKLVAIDPSDRYSADMALRHPWITRDSDKGVPLTFWEKNIAFR